MSVGITKSDCSSAELVHKMQGCGFVSFFTMIHVKGKSSCGSGSQHVPCYYRSSHAT